MIDFRSAAFGLAAGPRPRRLEQSAPLGDEITSLGPHLAFAENEGTPRPDDPAFGEQHAHTGAER